MVIWFSVSYKPISHLGEMKPAMLIERNLQRHRLASLVCVVSISNAVPSSLEINSQLLTVCAIL